MKHLLLSVVVAFIFTGCASDPMRNLNAEEKRSPAGSYSPTLETVVVLKDEAEGDYSPFFYHLTDGELLEMSMDVKTCRLVSVQKNQIFCKSSADALTLVGTLTAKKIGRQEEWVGYAIDWSNNVEVAETKTQRGMVFSIRIVK